MVDVSRLLGNIGFVAIAMALLALVESAAKDRASPPRRAHVLPNMGLTVVTLVVNVALTILLDGRAGGGILSVHLPPLAMTLLTLVVLDFATYVSHWSMHRVPAFWCVHRVHHSDPIVDVTTTLRQHPLEGLIRFGILAVPALVLGLPPEAVAVYRLVSVTNGLFEHVNVRMPPRLDRILSFFFITPNVHKVHHSKVVHETDSNFGNVFSAFDRLFGTLSAPREGVEYGLEGYDVPALQRLGALLRLPFRRARR